MRAQRGRWGRRSTSEIRNPYIWNRPRGERQSARWRGPRIGKYWRRCLHKAQRRWAKGHGRFRSVSRYSSVVAWKDS